MPFNRFWAYVQSIVVALTTPPPALELISHDLRPLPRPDLTALQRCTTKNPRTTRHSGMKRGIFPQNPGSREVGLNSGKIGMYGIRDDGLNSGIIPENPGYLAGMPLDMLEEQIRLLFRRCNLCTTGTVWPCEEDETSALQVALA